MLQNYTPVCVVGLGAAGAATLHTLASRGWPVTGIDPTTGAATTFNNQGWKHSGALYPEERTAAPLWAAFTRMRSPERRWLLNRCGHFLYRSEHALLDRATVWEACGIPVQRIPPGVVATASALGRPRCRGGVLTPDSVMDFSGLVSDIVRRAERSGARVVRGTTVRQFIREGNTLIGLVHSRNGREEVLHFTACILTAGAWTEELLSDIGVRLPVRRWKSHILTVEGELVEHITAFLDPPGLTLVPFKGRTLIADTRRVPANHGDDVSPVPETVEALWADFASYFPGLRRHAIRTLGVHAAIKTEFSETGGRNQVLAVFGPDIHGLSGLTVAFPGKASLMFRLARTVIGQLRAAVTVSA